MLLLEVPLRHVVDLPQADGGSTGGLNRPSKPGTDQPQVEQPKRLKSLPMPVFLLRQTASRMIRPSGLAERSCPCVLIDTDRYLHISPFIARHLDALSRFVMSIHLLPNKHQILLQERRLYPGHGAYSFALNLQHSLQQQCAPSPLLVFPVSLMFSFT